MYEIAICYCCFMKYLNAKLVFVTNKKSVF